MVDNGATHNFMREEVIRKFGLKFVPTQSHLNVVDTPLDQFIGVGYVVEVNIGEWLGKVDFTNVWIADYEAVLGI